MELNDSVYLNNQNIRGIEKREGVKIHKMSLGPPLFFNYIETRWDWNLSSYSLRKRNIERVFFLSLPLKKNQLIACSQSCEYCFSFWIFFFFPTDDVFDDIKKNDLINWSVRCWKHDIRSMPRQKCSKLRRGPEGVRRVGCVTRTTALR